MSSSSESERGTFPVDRVDEFACFRQVDQKRDDQGELFLLLPTDVGDCVQFQRRLHSRSVYIIIEPPLSVTPFDRQIGGYSHLIAVNLIAFEAH